MKNSNPYLKAQIANQIMIANHFIKECEMQALKNDGKIDKEERKLLDKINKATDKYKKELSNLSDIC